MAKRPTLSIPRKAKHKGLNNPISGLKPARSSLDYDQNLFTAPVKPRVRELQRKSSSFWEEDEDGPLCCNAAQSEWTAAKSIEKQP